MSIRVVPGEISTKGATTRTVIPTTTQPRWPPFERVAERIATARRPFPPHRHEGVEVFTYVVEGTASHQFGSEPGATLVAGSTTLLTAPTAVSHAINAGMGQTVRWFAAVAALPAGKASAPGLQLGRIAPVGVQPEGTILHRLVGPGSPLTSSVGMECAAIEFRSAGTSFQRVGHDRIAVCYALGGRGTVDNQPLEGGEAALVEDAAGVAIDGQRTFRIVLVSAPRGAVP
jgi:redox-sensitive bicupin YhaK (pirin superfamily)